MFFKTVLHPTTTTPSKHDDHSSFSVSRVKEYDSIDELKKDFVLAVVQNKIFVAQSLYYEWWAMRRRNKSRLDASIRSENGSSLNISETAEPSAMYDPTASSCRDTHIRLENGTFLNFLTYALEYAIEHGFFGIALFLVQQKTIQCRSMTVGMAIISGNVLITGHLLDFFSKVKDGFTANSYYPCFISNNKWLYSCFENYQPNMFVKSEDKKKNQMIDNFTPLEIAIITDNVTMARYLLVERNATIPDNARRTPEEFIRTTLKHSQYNMTILLLQHSCPKGYFANKSLVDHPLYCFLKNGNLYESEKIKHAEIVDQILQANSMDFDVHGVSAMQYAIRSTFNYHVAFVFWKHGFGKHTALQLAKEDRSFNHFFEKKLQQEEAVSYLVPCIAMLEEMLQLQIEETEETKHNSRSVTFDNAFSLIVLRDIVLRNRLLPLAIK